MIKELLSRMTNEQKIVFGIFCIKKACEEIQPVDFNIACFQWNKWLKWANGWLANQEEDARSSDLACRSMIHHNHGYYILVRCPLSTAKDAKDNILNGTYWISRAVCKKLPLPGGIKDDSKQSDNIFYAVDCAKRAFPAIDLKKLAEEAIKN